MQLDARVNIDDLARKSEGYSCADITTVCRDASFMAMRKKMEEIKDIAGLSVEEIKAIGGNFFCWFLLSIFDCCTEEMARLPVTSEAFEIAFQKIQSSVAQNEIQQHENWKTEFGSA